MTQPEKVWWHGLGCSVELVADERPTACSKCGKSPAVFEDMGWRVGFNPQTYVYYASYDAARKDKRVS